VSAAAIRGRSPFGVARGAFALLLGTLQAWREIGRSHADVVFATGGYASVPAGIAARLRRKPLIVYLPDVQPGWAVRFLSKLATRLATTSEAALGALPGRKTTVTGYPVRDEFWNVTKAEARRRLGLADDLPVLLVSGASQGARSINKAIAANAEALTDVCQVVHVTGKRDELWLSCARGTLPVDKLNRWQVHGYLHNLPLAMIAADLAVMRSGASVLGELPAAGLPAILVPYPHAGEHQKLNADYLQSKGAAIVLDDARLDVLAPTVLDLLRSPARLSAMRDATARLARPAAAQSIAAMVREAGA
jgi:UDP-N-acetylglucosamine--N-acetylmuramyl-(pentapeptide) pyrophosphoryl-undecaprenol N-acetylglucosamine transferase